MRCFENRRVSCDTVILNFFGSTEKVLDEEMEYKSPNSDYADNHPFLVRVSFPLEAFLSTDTYPYPIQYFAMKEYRSAWFSLKFAGYAQTVSCSFMYPWKQQVKETITLSFGILIGVALSVIIHKYDKIKIRRLTLRRSQI